MSVVRFMMLMPWGRVGSNLLVSILRQSKGMKLSGEYLNRLRTDEEQLSWIREYYELDSNEPTKPYIGTKQNMRAIRNFGAVNEILASHKMRIVRLRRDNVVKSAVSQIRAAEHAAIAKERDMRDQPWFLQKGESLVGPSRIDPDLLMTRINLMQTAQDQLMNAFSADAVLDIEYEQINLDLDDVVLRLQEYLDLPKTSYEVPHEKFTPDHLPSAITNYAEIEDRLADTPYRSMI